MDFSPRAAVCCCRFPHAFGARLCSRLGIAWREPLRKALKAGAALLGLGVLAVIAWKGIQLLLMVFAGVLFAVFLNALADWLCRRTGISYGWSLAAVVLTLVLVAVLMFFLAWPPLAEQAGQLVEQIPKAIQTLQSALEGSLLARVMPQAGAASRGIGSSLFSQLTQAISTVLDLAVAAVVILFVGIYLAAAPGQYRNGVVRLLPPARRARAQEVFATLGRVLRRWIIGRTVLMIANGTFTTVGLWILGIPLALVLGVIAGTLNFVPNIGPIVAAVPAVLIALGQSPRDAAYVALLYLVLQMTDGYIFTPLADRKAVSLPPALTITFQVLMGILTGTLGLLLATPIATAVAVLVQMLYLEDVLGEKVN